MFWKLLESNPEDVSGLVARIALGIVILPHGLQKLLGMFAGYGFSATIDFFSGIGIPTIVGFLIIMGESFGGLFLIMGLISRVSAFGITLIMLGAIMMVHLQFGFFMNWFGSQQGEGFEYHLLAIGLGLIIMINGAGKWSLDELILKYLKTGV